MAEEDVGTTYAKMGMENATKQKKAINAAGRVIQAGAKKGKQGAKDVLDVINDVFTDIESEDKLLGYAMILGGTAATCGIIPPLTKLLCIIPGNRADDIIGAVAIKKNKDDKYSDAEVLTAHVALFAAGALEVYIMTRPQTMPAMAAIAVEAIDAIGDAVSGFGGIMASAGMAL